MAQVGDMGTESSVKEITKADSKTKLYPDLPDELKSILLEDSDFNKETQTEKFKRKLLENPLIPIGCLFTTGALLVGITTISTRNRKLSQLMMRSRVSGQTFTVLSMVFGLLIGVAQSKK